MMRHPSPRSRPVANPIQNPPRAPRLLSKWCRCGSEAGLLSSRGAGVRSHEVPLYQGGLVPLGMQYGDLFCQLKAQ